MFGRAIVGNRTLARSLQVLALSGVLVPLTAAYGEETRLPIAKQTKPAPPEVRVPVGQGAIPPVAVVVSDSETPRELTVPTAGALRPIPPQGYATQAGGPPMVARDNRYAQPKPVQSRATNPVPGFASPRPASVLAPHAPVVPPSPAVEVLEPVTGQHEPMPTPAGQVQELAPPALEVQSGSDPVRPLPPQRTTVTGLGGETRSILTSTKPGVRVAPAQSEAVAPNAQAQVVDVPRYPPAARAAQPTPAPATEPTAATPVETPATEAPVVAEPAAVVVAEPEAPGVAEPESLPSTSPAGPVVAKDAPLEDAPVPFAPIPVPVPKTAAVPTTAKPIEIAPATFRDVEPGVTTTEQLVAAWGEPLERKGSAGAETLLYKIEPFSAVQVRMESDVVSSMLIRLDETLVPEKLAERLQLDFVRTVEVRDERGQAMGRAFPERGVLFGYDPSAETRVVAQVLLETIDPQAFYLRAETYWRSQAAASLEDLNYVVEQTPGDAAAQHLAARIYLSLGQVDVALEAVDKARELDPEENEYRLTRAQCLSQLGRKQEAEQEATAVRNADGIGVATKGRAFLLLGDLLASGSERDFKGAITLHMEAIKLVEPLAADPLIATRRKAKEVLLEASLAVARDVAFGNWNRKAEVVPKWIEKADAYARSAIEQDGAGLELRVTVIERAMAAHAGFKPAVDPSRFLGVAEELTKQLCETSKDPLAQQAAEWELGRIYNHAVRLAHLRGTADEGFKYGQVAQDKLENAAAGRGASLQARIEIGSLYFHIGVLHAVHNQDHDKAVAWYDRAQGLLVAEENRVAEDPAELGEMLISMGVSYWSVDLKQKGLELTKLGTSLVKEAVDQGTVTPESLIVPYGNLASMHAELGHADQAREINLTAEKLQQSQLK